MGFPQPMLMLWVLRYSMVIKKLQIGDPDIEVKKEEVRSLSVVSL